MEILFKFIEETLSSFDFAYCIAVNILTYLLIVLANSRSENSSITIWNKRSILVGVIVILGVVYYFLGVDIKTLINSAILAPVFWSWIMKPICQHFNIDYKQIDIK